MHWPMIISVYKHINLVKYDLFLNIHFFGELVTMHIVAIHDTFCSILYCDYTVAQYIGTTLVINLLIFHGFFLNNKALFIGLSYIMDPRYLMCN